LLEIPSAPGLVTVDLIASADAYVNAGQPTANFGSSTYLLVNPPSRTSRTYVMFDLSTIPPGAVVQQALLKLYVSQNLYYLTNQYLDCYAVGGSWHESTLNWNNQPNIVAGTAVSSQIRPSGSWMTWDVTSSASQYISNRRPNYGWCIRDPDEAFVEIPPVIRFNSRESGRYRPTLTLSFYPPRLEISGPSSADVNTWIKLRVERVDYRDRKITTGNLNVQLETSSSTGKFALTEGGNSISEVEIPNGKSYVELYYFDTNPGSVTIRVDTNQYRDDFYEGGVLRISLAIPDTEGPEVRVSASPSRVRELDLVSLVIDASDPSGISVIRLIQIGTDEEGRTVQLGLEEFPQGGRTVAHLELDVGPFPGMRSVEFVVEAEDIYGNVGEDSTSVVVERDTEGPKVFVRAEPSRVPERWEVHVSIEASDESGISKIVLIQVGTSIGGRETELGVEEFPLSGETTVHLPVTVGPFPGMRTVKFVARAFDIYGNVGEASDVVTVLLEALRWPPCGCGELLEKKIEGVKMFSHWDSLAAGDVLGDDRDEVVVAQDDYGGRLYVYVWDREENTLKPVSFEGGEAYTKIRYTHYDRLAIGDVLGDEKDEILIAIDDDQAIYVYGISGSPGAYELSLLEVIDLKALDIRFTHFDQILVGNFFDDDEKDELAISRDDDEVLFVLDNIDGNVAVYEFAAPSEGGFDEFRYTAENDNEEDDDNGHDEIVAGNFLGDGAEEIAYLDNNRNRLYVFGFRKSSGEWQIVTVVQYGIEFTKYDAACSGDVLGDDRDEILVFRDEDRLALVYDPLLGLVKLQYVFYSKYDGVAAGDLLGIGKEQVIVATDDHRSIFVFLSEDLGGG